MEAPFVVRNSPPSNKLKGTGGLVRAWLAAFNGDPAPLARDNIVAWQGGGVSSESCLPSQQTHDPDNPLVRAFGRSSLRVRAEVIFAGDPTSPTHDIYDRE